MRKSNREKTAILNAMSELVAYQDTDHNVLWVNKAAADSVKQRHENLIGKKCYEIWAGRQTRCEICPVADAIVTNDIKRYQIQTPDERIWNITGYPIKDETGKIIGAVELSSDITIAEKTKNELVESEERFRALVESAPMFIMLLRKGKIIYCNPKGAQILGYKTPDSLIGLDGPEIIAPEYRNIAKERIEKAKQGKSNPTIEVEMLNRNGKRIWVLASSVATMLNGEHTAIFVGKDITEIKQTEEQKIAIEKQLQQSQKMEAMGVLAGGIAHDFNNILFPLLGYAEMLKDEIAKDSPLQSHVDEILNAVMRSKELVQQILAFSRQQESELFPIKLQKTIKEALKLLRSSIPKTIGIQQDICADCEAVLADSTQIHQIMMNLATNAFHSMENTGGTLSVSLKQIRLNVGQSEFPELLPGKYALLSISDTGCGIRKDIMDKIFNPYFTTKESQTLPPQGGSLKPGAA